MPWARALGNYRGNVPGELNIKTGDVIILRRKVDENWFHGEANGSSGLVPANMVQVVNQLPQPLPLCRALYDFDTKDKDQEEVKDCLTFLKVRNYSVYHCLGINQILMFMVALLTMECSLLFYMIYILIAIMPMRPPFFQ